jgi:hypothetical protein
MQAKPQIHANLTMMAVSKLLASLKENEMPLTHPNRNRNQSAGRNQMQQKQSGDQHILPEDETALDPHRPHRVSREDMQKMRPADTDSDDTSSS